MWARQATQPSQGPRLTPQARCGGLGNVNQPCFMISHQKRDVLTCCIGPPCTSRTYAPVEAATVPPLDSIEEHRALLVSRDMPSGALSVHPCIAGHTLVDGVENVHAVDMPTKPPSGGETSDITTVPTSPIDTGQGISYESPSTSESPRVVLMEPQPRGARAAPSTLRGDFFPREGLFSAVRGSCR